MSARKTQEEINLQIEGLKKSKLELPRFSMFGDDNWAKIDAQLDVLEGKQDPDDFYVDESSEEYSDGDNDIYNAAQEAEEWMDGNVEGDLL